MFRITSRFSAARICLVRRRLEQSYPITLNAPSYKQSSPREREPCLPPPPKRDPPRDVTALLSVLGFLVASGAFAVYAKTNPELRDWLTIHAPWFDDIIAAAYQENMTYMELAKHLTEDAKDAVVRYLTEKKPRQCSSDGTPVPTVESAPGGWKDEDEEDDEDDDEGDYVVVNLYKSNIGDEEECEKISPPILTKDICEIEQCLKDIADTVLINYMTCRDACNYYNRFVVETMASFKVEDLKELKAAMVERIALVKDSLAKANCAASQLEQLSKYLDCGVQAPKDAIQNTKDLLKELNEKITTVQFEYIWENDKSLATDMQVEKVTELMTKYLDENQTMFIGLDYESSSPNLTGDPDLLLYHTVRYVNKLKKDLSEAMCGMTDRINRGIESLPDSPQDKKKRDYELKNLFNKKKYELDAEYKKRLEVDKANKDKILKTALKQQLERHEENMKTKIEEKEIEAKVKLAAMVRKAVSAEKKQMAIQKDEMDIKIKIVQDKLDAKLKAESETRRSQQLYTAGASLLAATKKGDPYVNVDKEIKAIEKASGNGDKLVESVLKAIPKGVREKGLVPESVLRQKYKVVETTALKVALVEQEGAPLPVYFFSLIQYYFLFMKIPGIPQEEFEKPPKVPPPELDTFDLLQRARFYMERGNLSAALRHVNALKGASLAACAVWREAMREHLETKQAAEALLAHALALALQYV